jgi:hypothetical protein
MSIYEVNLVGRRVLHDPEFREQLRTNPESALSGLELADEERDALLAGEVGRLYALGAHEYLLMNLARYGVLGLDAVTFSDRIRGASRSSAG